MSMLVPDRGWGPLTLKAFKFAMEAHSTQERQYTELPYIFHPVAVAETLREVGFRDEVTAAAMLHDVLEDTPVGFGELIQAFPNTVSHLVVELTDVYVPGTSENRASRKQLERKRLAKVSPDAQSIKVADLIDNTPSIAEFASLGFARLYLNEMRALLNVLKEAEPKLIVRAYTMLAGAHDTVKRREKK